MNPRIRNKKDGSLYIERSKVETSHLNCEGHHCRLLALRYSRQAQRRRFALHTPHSGDYGRTVTTQKEDALKTGAVLEDIKVHVRFRLAALWTSVMFCYIYADYFKLYQAGTVQGMMQGSMGPLGAASQSVLLGTSVMLAIPAAMIFLSLVLKPRLSRGLNLGFGTIYTLIEFLTIPGGWAFYQLFGLIEVVFTLLVVWYAWGWPSIKPDNSPVSQLDHPVK